MDGPQRGVAHEVQRHLAEQLLRQRLARGSKAVGVPNTIDARNTHACTHKATTKVLLIVVVVVVIVVIVVVVVVGVVVVVTKAAWEFGHPHASVHADARRHAHARTHTTHAHNARTHAHARSKRRHAPAAVVGHNRPAHLHHVAGGPGGLRLHRRQLASELPLIPAIQDRASVFPRR
jgi:hypothetical protein